LKIKKPIIKAGITNNIVTEKIIKEEKTIAAIKIY
jgi:hypothetical protein